MSARRFARPLALGWAAIALGGAALLPVLADVAGRLPRCPLRAATGWPCPTCGSGRALAALASGELGAALAANPLVVAVGFAFVGLGVAAGLAELGGRPLAEPRELPRWARLALPAALVANWLYLVGAGR